VSEDPPYTYTHIGPFTDEVEQICFWHRDILQRTTFKLNFSNWFVVAGAGFLSFLTYLLIKFEEEKRFGL
jgi:hypothetical protein